MRRGWPPPFSFLLLLLPVGAARGLVSRVGSCNPETSVRLRPTVSMSPRNLRRYTLQPRARFRLTEDSVDKMAAEVDALIATYDLRQPKKTRGSSAAKNWMEGINGLRDISQPVALTDEMTQIRNDGKQILEEMNLPHKKAEPYRFLNLRRLYNHKFEQASGDVDLKVLEAGFQEETDGYRQVFVDGVFSDEYSSFSNDLPDGAYVGGLQNLPDRFRDDVIEQLGIVHEDLYGSKFFSALNKANIRDVAVIAIPEGVKLTEPLQITFYSSPSKEKEKHSSANFPRIVVLSGKDSKATVYINHMGGRNAQYQSNPVTTVKLQDGSEFNMFSQIQHSKNAVHVEAVNATILNDAKFVWRGLLNGGTLSRVNLAVDLTGDDAECDLVGASLANDGAQMDIHTMMRHTGKRGVSKQEHRSMIGDRAHAIFRGQVLIKKPAIGCEADQQSRALLLSDTGTVDQMPTLVVEPDDVEGAAHGSTVSDLQGEELFYMMCRGISEETAKIMLTKGFIRHIIQEFPFENMKARLMDQITEVAHSASVQWRYTDIEGDEFFDGFMARDEEMAGVF